MIPCEHLRTPEPSLVNLPKCLSCTRVQWSLSKLDFEVQNLYPKFAPKKNHFVTTDYRISGCPKEPICCKFVEHFEIMDCRARMMDALVWVQSHLLFSAEKFFKKLAWILGYKFYGADYLPPIQDLKFERLNAILFAAFIKLPCDFSFWNKSSKNEQLRPTGHLISGNHDICRERWKFRFQVSFRQKNHPKT